MRILRSPLYLPAVRSAYIYDMKPYLKKGTVFETFSDYDNFKRVYLDECGCVSWDIDPKIDSDTVWSNKVDLCPDACYIDSLPTE